MNRLTFSALFTSLVVACSTATAATVVYSEDFSSGSAGGFTGVGSVLSAAGMTGYNGFADNVLWNTGTAGQASNLSLSGLATHTSATISFSLAFVDSWDGPFGGDFFSLLVDGGEVLKASIHHTTGNQELVPAALTNRSPRVQAFGNSYNYYLFYETMFDVSLALPHSGSDMNLSIFASGGGWQGGMDESWAIDNVVVSTNAIAPVPLPAGLPLLLSGFGLLALAKRRKRT